MKIYSRKALNNTTHQRMFIYLQSVYTLPRMEKKANSELPKSIFPLMAIIRTTGRLAFQQVRWRYSIVQWQSKSAEHKVCVHTTNASSTQALNISPRSGADWWSLTGFRYPSNMLPRGSNKIILALLSGQSPTEGKFGPLLPASGTTTIHQNVFPPVRWPYPHLLHRCMVRWLTPSQ